MSTSNTTTLTGSTTRRPLWIACLVVLLCLFFPTSVLAASPDPNYQGPGTCAQCHPDEATTWGDCPHAQAEVTCEVCHGAYVPGHPQEGLMQLPVDASNCQDCHTVTYDQWHQTAHAGANVQCTSCHLAHSQETRLAGEELCGSCHREELSDWAHHNAGVTCIDCHVSSPSAPAGAADVQVKGGATAPDHGFELVVEACATCHGQSMHQQVFDATAVQVDQARLAQMTDRTRELAYELEDVRRTNRSLQTVSVVSLGFGMGVGGVLGAIFVLIIGHVAQRSDRQ